MKVDLSQDSYVYTFGNLEAKVVSVRAPIHVLT